MTTPKPYPFLVKYHDREKNERSVTVLAENTSDAIMVAMSEVQYLSHYPDSIFRISKEIN